MPRGGDKVIALPDIVFAELCVMLVFPMHYIDNKLWICI